MTTPQDPFGPPRDEGRDGEQPPPEQPHGAQPGQPYGAQPGQPYGAPPGQPYGTPWGQTGPKRNGLGTAALVLGLLALILFWTIVGGIVLGLLAIGLGIAGRRRATRGEADNGGVAVAGVVLGVLSLLASAAVVAAGVSLFNSDSGQDLLDCLEQASDQAALEQCQREFEDSVGG